MTRSRTTTLLLVAVVLLVAMSAWLLGNGSAGTPASAAMETPPADRAREGVLVSATGEVVGVPDTLRADFAVRTTAATVDEALNLANAAMTQMQEALVDGGVARADLQTSNASIQPAYGRQGRITGYAVDEGLTAKIRTTSEAGSLITAAIAAGGDAAQLSGVSFEIEQDDALLDAARRNAFADAQAKAELYAEQAGRALGQVVSVTEKVPSNEIMARAGSWPEAAVAFPLQPGREQLAVTVTVEWSFR
ncbi:MAG TPA: SIMPL domain-containing protein [Jiangellaceae bacterium]